ncbi:MAG: DUF4405 domain-containing protein [Planctomycetota bacterium]|jgi:hypothetical protein
MKRTTLNFFVDLISFATLIGMVCTGLIMKYVLPPGTGACGTGFRGGRGQEQVRDLWSMTRHEWGQVHFDLAVLFTILMVVHIILHWTWIKNYFKRLLRSPQKTTGPQS